MTAIHNRFRQGMLGRSDRWCGSRRLVSNTKRRYNQSEMNAEALRRWLGKFNGSRLVVPRLAPGWTWTGGVHPLAAAANQAALAVRQLAEGQEVRTQTGTPAWRIVVYIFAGLFCLEILLALIGLTISFFAR
jgi:hypothetical protein